MSSVSVNLKTDSPAKLATAALSEIDASPAVQADLSYIGSFYALASKVAVLKASGKADLGSVASLSADALAQVYTIVAKLAPEVMADMAGSIGGAVGEALPFVGVAVAAYDSSVATTDAWNEEARDKCRTDYVPPAPATGLDGYVPADLLQGSMGDVFAFADQAYKASAGTLWLLKSDDTWTKATIPSQPGIPASRKRILAMLRTAIKKSYGDPTTDGGLMLWPVYLDLLTKEIDKGHVRLEQVYYDYAMYGLMPLWRHKSGAAASSPVKGGCILYEHRGFDEFKETLRRWKVQLNPIYVQDKASADALKKEIAEAEAELLGKRPDLRFLHHRSSTGPLVIAGGALVAKMLGWW